jgi:hypothetical protein
MTASTIPPLSVWPCGTPFGNTQEGPDRLRSATITDPLSRGFGIPNRSPDPLVQRAGRDHPFPIFARFSNDGNPLETAAGAVSKDKEAPSTQLGDAMVFGEECFTSARVNHIQRVTKPNTKRATNICPNSLFQIGAWGLRFNCPPNH